VLSARIVALLERFFRTLEVLQGFVLRIDLITLKRLISLCWNYDIIIIVATIILGIRMEIVIIIKKGCMPDSTGALAIF
jgi:hypothetical protein